MAVQQVAKRFRAVVSAARRIDVSTDAAVKATIRKRANWQEEIWGYYDEVPEVKFALNFLANGMQKVRFFAGVRSEDGKSIIPVEADGSPIAGTPLAKQADFEMSRVRNGVSGQGEINRLLTLNLEAPGECHLHGIQAIEQIGMPGMDGFVAGRAESWDVRSVSEVEVTDQKTMDPITGVSRPKILIKKSPDDKGAEFDYDNETLIRFWQRHPRFTEWADSLLRSCMSDCEMLTLLTGEAKAISKSRHSAGAFTLPSELSFVDDQKKGDEPQENEDGEDTGNPFVNAFMAHQVDPITDPSSSSSVQRLIISGPSEFLKPDVLRTIDLGRPADDKLTEKMDRHINRLARGLNVPVEVVMGHMSTTFSNAEQIDQDTFDDHFEPRCVAIGDGYATGFLRPQLEENGYTAEDVAIIEVGFDASDLVRDQSMDQKADTLFEHGAIGYEAYRRYRGATEDDAPDDVERIRNLAERKGILTAEVFTALMSYAGIDLNVASITTPAPPIETIAVPSPDVPNQETPQAIAASARRPFGRRLADIDRTLRTRLAGAVDMAMLRALEKAGNRLKTAKATAVRAAAANIPTNRIPAHLGPALIAEAGLTPDDLLEGAWGGLGQAFKEWASEAGDAALDVVDEILGGSLGDKRRTALRARQTASIDDAWIWLEGRLTAIGKKALFAPDALVAAIGELDSQSHVATGVLRETLIRAGGGSGFRSADGVITPTNKMPLGGIATGEEVMSTLGSEGVGVEGYVWVYGPARRRGFEPHAQLDGVLFVNFDDASLANTSGWPDTSHFYPGDHNGCVCDFEPIMLAGTGDIFQPLPEVHFLQDYDVDAALRSESSGLNQDQLKSVQAYTGSVGYDINLTLRRMASEPGFPRRRFIDDHVRQIDSAMSPLPENVLVHRGMYPVNMDDFQAIRAGDKFVEHGFMSTSSSDEIAKRFGNGVQMEIEVPKGTPSIWIKNVEGTYNQKERELLLKRGTTFEVKSTSRIGSTVLLKMRVIPS